MVDEDAGERLDLIVSRRLELSRTNAATLIANGNVTVNGKAERSSYRGEPGDRIAVTVPPPPGRDIVGESIPLDVWQQSLAINRIQPQVMAWVQQYSKKTLFQP